LRLLRLRLLTGLGLLEWSILASASPWTDHYPKDVCWRKRTRWAGLLLGLIWVVTASPSGAEVLYLPLNPLQLAHQRASRIDCANHQIQILLAARVWSMDHADQPPPDFQTLTNELGAPAVLFCPANLLSSVPTNWTQLDWNQIDYEWLPLTNWAYPTNLVLSCRIHNGGGQAQGSVIIGGPRPGWPVFTAGPLLSYATPHEDIHLGVKIASDAIEPLNYQWRREHLSFVTNVVGVTNPDDPKGVIWRTNVVPNFTSTNLVGKTNPTLSLSDIQTNDSDYYCVAVTNVMGVSVSYPVRLLIDPSFAGITTNEHWSQIYCLNNLKMIGLARSLWAVDHNDQLAPDFAVLTNSDGSQMLGWPSALFCRSDTNRVAPTDWPGLDFSDTSYEMLSSEAQTPYTPVCRCRIHGYYLQMDGEVIKQPRFETINHLPNNSFELSFRVFANRTNILEASTDLSMWTALADYMTNGDCQYIDTQGAQRRFYRLRLP
jgi:hypothetical protein